MIVKSGKYWDIKHIGKEGCIYGLEEEDLMELFWDLTRVLAPLRGEIEYPNDI